MAPTRDHDGQRHDTTDPSGKKERSPTSTPHKGSRVEPSHVTEHKREQRDKKAHKTEEPS